MYYYRGIIADTEVTCAFRHAGTAENYGKWLKPCERAEEPVTVPEADVKEWEKKWGFRDNAFAEFGLSIYHISNTLLKRDRCVFHAAAFLMEGKAYLLTAASGVGKSTQLKHLAEQYKEEIRVMNGDKPVLGPGSDGRLWVYPSPWKGKEGWGDDSLSAPVGGVIILERGTTDVIRTASARDAAAFLMTRILFTAESRRDVLAAGKIVEKLIGTSTVRIFVNTGEPNGSEIIYRAIRGEC